LTEVLRKAQTLQTPDPGFQPANGCAVLDLAPGLENWFLFDEVEDSYEISAVSGRVPEWLRGTWYINGPARFERAGVRYKHWLDGDGMVCALRFASDGLRFTNRFIRTGKLKDEEAAGRFVYRGFGTAFPDDRLRRKVMLESPVNVSVYPYAGRLLALGEQSLPYELDPGMLATRGEFDFHGALNEVTPFSAHAKLDRGLLNFGVAFSARQPFLNVYEFDDAGNLLNRRRYALRHPYSIHDFGFTRSRALFFLSPLLMNFERFLNGASVIESLSWQPELGSRILVAPRAGSAAEPFTVETGGGYCLHFINCFEESGHLVVDVLLLDAPVYPEYQPVPNLFANAPQCRPARFLIDLERCALADTCVLNYPLAQDFPSIDPLRAGRTSSDFWMLGISELGKPGRKFFDLLARGSWKSGAVADSYTAPRGEYLCGEPCLVANPRDRQEAVVISERFEAPSKAGSVVLFDAFNVRGGPIASIPLRRPVHPGFHTTFIPLVPQRGSQ
jgi:carotenoid cleavage dioxygenase-like enzyme